MGAIPVFDIEHADPQNCDVQQTLLSVICAVLGLNSGLSGSLC
jgi:hypothetical protein